jgi:hypothetical protein
MILATRPGAWPTTPAPGVPRGRPKAQPEAEPTR